MPVPAKPRYHAKSKRWYINIGPRDEKGRATEVWMVGRVDDADPPEGPGDERQAYRWLEAWQRARRRPPAPRPEMTVEAVCQRYLAWCEGRAAAGEITLPDHRNRVSCLSRACAVLGSLQVASLTADHHQELVRKLRAEGLSRAYIRGIHVCLQGALNWAARPVPGRPAPLVDRNPLAGVAPPRVPRVRGRYVGREGIGQLWVWAAGRARRLRPDSRHFERVFLRYFAFLLATGCRPGEAIRLRWDQVDWGRSLAVLREHKTDESTGRDRVIPLSPRALRILRRLHSGPRRHPVYVFPHRPAKGTGKRATAEERRCGQPWAESQSAARALRRMRRRAIDAGCELEDLGPGRLTGYSARYRSITDQLRDGLPRDVVSRIHGNSPKMVADVYEQLEEEQLAQLLARRERGGG